MKKFIIMMVIIFGLGLTEKLSDTNTAQKIEVMAAVKKETVKQVTAVPTPTSPKPFSLTDWIHSLEWSSFDKDELDRLQKESANERNYYAYSDQTRYAVLFHVSEGYRSSFYFVCNPSDLDSYEAQMLFSELYQTGFKNSVTFENGQEDKSVFYQETCNVNFPERKIHCSGYISSTQYNRGISDDFYSEFSKRVLENETLDMHKKVGALLAFRHSPNGYSYSEQ